MALLGTPKVRKTEYVWNSALKDIGSKKLIYFLFLFLKDIYKRLIYLNLSETLQI
jgi:hypothetical protein